MERTFNRRPFELAFIIATVGGFAAWLATVFIQGGGSGQFSIFFRECNDFLADTLNVTGYSSQLDPYHNTMYTGLGEKAYPPLTYAVMYLFSRLVDMDTYWYRNYFLSMYGEPRFLIIYMICSTVVIILVYELIRSVKKGSGRIKVWTAAAVLMSAPVLYSYERANTIILTMFFVMYYLFHYDSKTQRKRELAMLALAAAIALKMTPAVLGILLVYKKEWKEILHLLLFSLILGLGPFVFLEGGFANLVQMFRNIQENLNIYSSLDGCTLTACVKGLFGLEAPNVMKIVTWAICLFLLGVSFLYDRKWETVMAVCIVLVILPSHSGYYCILYLIPATVAFLNESRHRAADWLVCLGLLLISFDIQHVLYPVVSHYTGILLITAVLLVRAVRACVGRLRGFGS